MIPTHPTIIVSESIVQAKLPGSQTSQAVLGSDQGGTREAARKWIVGHWHNVPRCGFLIIFNVTLPKHCVLGCEPGELFSKPTPRLSQMASAASDPALMKGHMSELLKKVRRSLLSARG